MAINEKDSIKGRLKKEVTIYPKIYLEGFGRSINKYRKETTLSTGEVVNIIDWDMVMFKAGVKTQKGALTWFMKDGVRVFNIEKFEEVRRQYEAMMAGRDYGKEKELEQLDKTAEQMDADREFDDFNK